MTKYQFKVRCTSSQLSFLELHSKETRKLSLKSPIFCRCYSSQSLLSWYCCAHPLANSQALNPDDTLQVYGGTQFQRSTSGKTCKLLFLWASSSSQYAQRALLLKHTPSLSTALLKFQWSHRASLHEDVSIFSRYGFPLQLFLHHSHQLFYLFLRS